MKKIVSLMGLAMTMFAISSCCWWDSFCDPCESNCYDRPCPEPKPTYCCPKPHIWDRSCCNPGDYEY